MKFKSFLFVICFLYIFLIYACNQDKPDEILSKSFELRYVSSDIAANGITDFKGPTSIFDLDERLDYLTKFADYGAVFFNDPGLNTKVIQQEVIDSVMRTLKPQPYPNIRRLIELDQWKYLGYKEDQREIELQNIKEWQQMANARVLDEALHLSKGEITRSFSLQNWRLGFSWKLNPLEKKQDVSFSFSEAVKVGLSNGGSFFYISEGDTVTKQIYQPDRFYSLKVEIDLESGRYNFLVNDELLADFVLLSEKKQNIDRLTIKSSREVILDDLWGVGYALGDRGSRTHPYFINTFMDEDFSALPSLEGFEQMAYDDSQWKEVPYKRYAHGGERNRDEILYLRKKITIDDFETARLKIETVRPTAEIFINGTRIKEVGRVPETIDVSQVLKPGTENLIAVKVNPFAVDEVKHHMSTDRWSSWFAGLMKLELTNASYINDVFAYTSEIGKTATLQILINAISEKDEEFTGKLITEFYPWYPEESNEIAAQSIETIHLDKGISKTIEQSIVIKNPVLWTTASPNLYKVRIELQDEDGNPLDDYVLTTGLRTIRQEGGTFRINGKPEVLFGPLIFNQPYPLEKISKWMFSPPESKWVETILECKKMNSNAIRMSVHDQRVAGVNDRRLAQIGDQMGIMFMWQTPCWIREGTTEDFDFDAISKYMQSVQNNPSIVIWQPGNHPHEYTPDWYGRVLFHLSQHDPSRLISPAAALYHMKLEEHEWPGDDGNIIPGWTHPQLARGNMEQIPSYGRDWRVVREFGSGINKYVAVFNDSLRMEYLNSNTHAWFDYESEETIGMPNWDLHKGKPYYHMYSYEKDYNKGNIGRILEFSEWRESQAWQALSAYETYRKKRWLDYDGMNWCPLRGGPNTATYMKPVIEYSGEAKLAFYALQMVYQRVLAGSKNVDIVYGPDDEVPVIVMNLDKSKTVDVLIMVKTMEGEIVAQKEYDNVDLEAGRTVTELGTWKPELKPEMYYSFEYYVK